MDELWFGTLQNLQWVPMPATVQRRYVSFVESGTLERGGGFVSRSNGRHVEYEFTYPPVREAQGISGLDVFQEFATGLWNDFATPVDGFNPNDLVYFVDPMNVRANLFPPHWASPMLGLTGDWPWVGEYASHAATAANSYRQPLRTVTFNVTHTASTLPAQVRRRCIIPIPPGYSLWWGWSGARTGTGVVRAEAHHKTGGATLVQTVAPLSATAATRMDQSISGDTYDYVTFGFSRTSAVTSTVSPASLMARLFPLTESPTLTGLHVEGLGTTGCVFLDDAIPETYGLISEPDGRHLKGLSFGLKEIGTSL